MDKKQSRELRRKLRHTANPDHTFAWGFIAENLAEAVDRFFALMRSSSPAKSTFLEDPQHVDFFRRMVPIMAAQGWLALSFLQIDGRDAAAYLSFDFHNEILLYNSGQNPAFGSFSPGIVLLAYIIEDAILKKRTLFDFLRGDEEYKYRMGGQDTAVMMLNAHV